MRASADHVTAAGIVAFSTNKWLSLLFLNKLKKEVSSPRDCLRAINSSVVIEETFDMNFHMNCHFKPIQRVHTSETR